MYWDRSERSSSARWSWMNGSDRMLALSRRTFSAPWTLRSSKHVTSCRMRWIPTRRTHLRHGQNLGMLLVAARSGLNGNADGRLGLLAVERVDRRVGQHDGEHEIFEALDRQREPATAADGPAADAASPGRSARPAVTRAHSLVKVLEGLVERCTSGERTSGPYRAAHPTTPLRPIRPRLAIKRALSNMCILPPHSRMTPMMRGCGTAERTLSVCS